MHCKKQRQNRKLRTGLTTGLLMGMALAGHSCAQTGRYNYQKELMHLYTSVHQEFYIADSGFFREHALGYSEPHEPAVSYLWGLCAMLQAACEMDRLEPGRRYMEGIYAVVAKYDDPAPPRSGL